MFLNVYVHIYMFYLIVVVDIVIIITVNKVLFCYIYASVFHYEYMRDMYA